MMSLILVVSLEELSVKVVELGDVIVGVLVAIGEREREDDDDSGCLRSFKLFTSTSLALKTR